MRLAEPSVVAAWPSLKGRGDRLSGSNHCSHDLGKGRDFAVSELNSTHAPIDAESPIPWVPFPMAAKDVMHFVYGQARRFVSARPWERLAHASLGEASCRSMM